MPEANLTKRALTQALKELVRSRPFDKVGVNDVCDACQVSRKTFYYHFQDKYALVEWIFETEFISVMKRSDVGDRWTVVEALCRYLYQERDYYERLMQFNGQNSFRQYFQDFLFNVVEQFIIPEPGEIDAVANRGGIAPEEVQAFYTHFIADAVLFSIFRWLNEGTKLPPEDFVSLLKSTDDLIYVQVNKRAEAMDGNRADDL